MSYWKRCKSCSTARREDASESPGYPHLLYDSRSACILSCQRGTIMSGKIILLVEDNPDDVALTLRALKKNNIANEVVVAGDGAEALEYLMATGKYAGRATSDPPEIVLLDLKLPKAGGLEVLRAMRADPRTRLLPVVVLTSSAEETDVISSYQLGANSYIRKPVDFDQFVDAIRQLGLYWLVLNRAPLLQSQKMEAIGQLAGGVAHDFNNLLTGILGNIALMRSNLPPEDPLLENLVAAETAARQAADLTKGLLTFSRGAMVLPVPMNLTAALDVTLALLKQSLPATMEIVRDYEQTTWNILVDQSQLTQILLNLAVNARDAMKGKGTLTIRTRNVTIDTAYVHEHFYARTGEFIHLSVTDTGPGMSSEVMQHLFEPFHTTKPTGSGTGLGLSIVYGAVKQADGWITAVSTEGVGRTVPQKPPSEAPLGSTPRKHPSDWKNIRGGIGQTCSGATFDIYLPRCLEEPIQSVTPSPL